MIKKVNQVALLHQEVNPMLLIAVIVLGNDVVRSVPQTVHLPR